MGGFQLFGSNDLTFTTPLGQVAPLSNYTQHYGSSLIEAAFDIANPVAYRYYLFGVTQRIGQPLGARIIEVDGFAAAVPEPASWAMMIAGFGVVGGALRRRKTRTSVRFA